MAEQPRCRTCGGPQDCYEGRCAPCFVGRGPWVGAEARRARRREDGCDAEAHRAPSLLDGLEGLAT